MTLLSVFAPTSSELTFPVPSAAATALGTAPSVIVAIDADVSPPAAAALAHAETSDTSWHFTRTAVVIFMGDGADSVASAVPPALELSHTESPPSGSATASGATPSADCAVNVPAPSAQASSGSPASSVSVSPSSADSESSADGPTPTVAVIASGAIQQASGNPPLLSISLDSYPDAASAEASATAPQASVNESNDAPSCPSFATATAPGVTVSSLPAPSGAIAGALYPLAGWDLPSYVEAAHEALRRHKSVVESDLAGSEADLNAASTVAARDAALAACDENAARLTYCNQALDELERAVVLTTMYEPIGVP